MQFVFEKPLDAKETNILQHSIKRQWVTDDVFSPGEVCALSNETARLKWSQVFVSLAFGEATAFYGFGARIAAATDLSTKVWLTVHLQDEARHTEGFSRFLSYLYPSHQGQHERLFSNRHAYLFYGNTERCQSILEWLLCTQMAEVFGQECYASLHRFFQKDPIGLDFMGRILIDEASHIAYIGHLIEQYRALETTQYWNTEIHSFIDKMLPLCRNMFEGRGNSKMFRAFQDMEIDVSQFCDHAFETISRRYLQ